MSVAEFKVIARHDLDADLLQARLHAFNVQATGYDDGQDLAFVVEDGGEMIAGVAGYTWGGISEIHELWVHEAHRGAGLGSALMRSAIDEATARGCRLMFLSSHSFQAPAFYARLGFETVAVIEDKPLGFADHILRRVLAA